MRATRRKAAAHGNPVRRWVARGTPTQSCGGGGAGAPCGRRGGIRSRERRAPAFGGSTPHQVTGAAWGPVLAAGSSPAAGGYSGVRVQWGGDWERGSRIVGKRPCGR
jgi:hypothetical protein